MSLAAAMLVSGAYALDNVKVNGSTKLIYQTSDVDNTTAGQTTGLFKRGQVGGTEAARGGAQLLLGATADLAENFSAGTEAQAFTTLGLENSLVSNVMATGNLGVTTKWNMAQAWLAASLAKTTVKVGRMELDTPLLFTEDWNVAKNTFEAAVAINQDLPNTTLVGAWVGGHNGIGGGQTAQLDGRATYTDNNSTATNPGTIVDGGSDPFTNFAGGAYAVGVVNTSIEKTTLQAWYYNIQGSHDFSNLAALPAETAATIIGGSVAGIDNVAAYWLQADTKLLDMLNVGAQYSNIDLDVNNPAVKDSEIYAVKVGGAVSGVNLFAAYSSADEDGALSFANTSTGDKTKIYTGADSIYMDGIVTTPGADAWKIGASTKVSMFDLAANYTGVEIDNANGTSLADVDGFDFSVGTKVGAVALKAIYTMYEQDSVADVTNLAGDTGTIYNGFATDHERDTIRVIAGLKF